MGTGAKSALSLLFIAHKFPQTEPARDFRACARKDFSVAREFRACARDLRACARVFRACAQIENASAQTFRACARDLRTCAQSAVGDWMQAG